MYAHPRPALDSAEFLAALAGVVNAPLGRGGEILLLNNGIRFFPSVLADIARAVRTIDFSVFFWEDGEVARQMIEVLAERARSGVAIRLLVDDFGAIGADGDELARLRATGAQVRRCRRVRLHRLLRSHRRNHRRAIVIDGRVGYTGGAAIADKWRGDARDPREWRDSLTRVTGMAAAMLQSAFAEAWASATGEIIAGPGFYDGHFASLPACDSEPRFIHLASSPSREDHPLRQFFQLSVLCARREVFLTTSYFVPDAATRSAVTEQARRGVDVRILVQGSRYKAGPIRLAARHHYGKLLGAGVRIYEYEPTMLHAKHLVADGIWSVVGSANLDVRSQAHNQENVLGVRDAAFATSLRDTFLQDITRAREITLADWCRRGVVARAGEWVWSRFTGLL